MKGLLAASAIATDLEPAFIAIGAARKSLSAPLRPVIITADASSIHLAPMRAKKS